MALFPAYSSGDLENNTIRQRVSVSISEKIPSQCSESELLASDSDESEDEPAAKLSRVFVSAPSTQSHDDFYIDCKLDRGNLRVSTLYYPGRPQYECAVRVRDAPAPDTRARRYFTRRVADTELDPGDLQQRVSHYRDLLRERPADVTLWENFIDFQERCSGEEATLQAAEEAAMRLPHSARLRERLLDSLRVVLTPHDLLLRLRSMLGAERSGAGRVVLWEALLEALGSERGTDAAQLTAAAAAALRDTPREDAPRILHALGSYLRAAGLWERLVLLIELTVAMNYSPAVLYPPDPDVLAAAERRQQETEDQAISSGLPLSAVWVRVERARASCHWRPAPPPTLEPTSPLLPPADPQRVPLPHDVADLLLPVSADDQLLHLSVRLLLLAKVPMLPGTDSWTRWAGRGGAGAGGESLLPLVWAGRSLPPTHPARPAPELARRLLALLVDPPHYFSDEAGYLSWVTSLWEVCSRRAAGATRTALVCWRLRWLQTLCVLSVGDEAETRRLRAEGRSLLRRLEPTSPLPYAECARLDWLAASGAEGTERALQAAGRALRASLADASCPPHHALYVARVVCEIGGGTSGAGVAALVTAVIGRDTRGTPTEEERRHALLLCEKRCEDIEREFPRGEDDEGGGRKAGYCVDLLLPGSGEWVRARSALAPPTRRAQLTERVCGAAPSARGPSAARYWEEAAESLALTARVAARLSPLFPHNAALAVVSAGAPLWACPASCLGRLSRPVGVSVLASSLPAWLAALRSDFSPAETEALVRVCRRVAGRGLGPDEAALAWSARFEAEARAARPRLPHALYAALFAALERAPQYKWVYVRGAAVCGGEAGLLADALLDRSLRLHALPVELEPLPAVTREE